MKSFTVTSFILLFVFFITLSTVLFFSDYRIENTTKKFSLDKKYWTTKDYEKILADIKYNFRERVKPSYSNQELILVYKKLVDHENFLVVINDENLKVNHKSNFSSEMFRIYQQMIDVYDDVNGENKQIYPLETIEILHFGLNLQLHYFRLKNEAIIQNADDPETEQIQELLKNNIQVLISNYSNYLNFVKQETSFNKHEISEYVKGFELYFVSLIEKYPEADFNEIVAKLDAMAKKAKSQTLVAALEKLREELVPEIENPTEEAILK